MSMSRMPDALTTPCCVTLGSVENWVAAIVIGAPAAPTPPEPPARVTLSPTMAGAPDVS